MDSLCTTFCPSYPYLVWGTRSSKDYSNSNSNSNSNSKCIGAQVLNCANGCAVYYFLPSYTKSGAKGLPRTIAIAIAIANAFAFAFAFAFALRY
jgi:hypothetical protein